jgi:single-stranded-DNA-specific exonuclease
LKKGNTLLERWVVIAKKADFYGIAERFGIDPVTARVIRNRDIVGDEAIRE